MTVFSLGLFLDSALKALLLGTMVFLAIKLTRLRDLTAESLIWTGVLAAAMAMPLMVLALPGLAIPLPHLPDAPPPPPAIAIGLVGGSGEAAAPWPIWQWLQTHLHLLAWTAYGAVAAVGLARIATGLVLTLRLYRTARPINASWAQGLPIRASSAVTGPISFGPCILLPTGYAAWSPTKLAAVLAHEQSHIRRGDFVIQLFAAIHRALFWFSPFAWWLQHRLCALAECASDEAAIRRIDDPTSYAEILVDISRHAHATPALIAMTKGPDIGWRIDRILGPRAPDRALGLGMRLVAVALVLPMAGTIAAAHAAVAPLVPPLPAQKLVWPSTMTVARATVPVAPSAPVAAHPAARHPKHARAKSAKAAAAQADAVTYDPRALLADHEAVLLPALVPVGDKGKNSGQTAIIMNLNN